MGPPAGATVIPPNGSGWCMRIIGTAAQRKGERPPKVIRSFRQIVIANCSEAIELKGCSAAAVVLVDLFDVSPASAVGPLHTAYIYLPVYNTRSFAAPLFSLVSSSIFFFFFCCGQNALCCRRGAENTEWQLKGRPRNPHSSRAHAKASSATKVTSFSFFSFASLLCGSIRLDVLFVDDWKKAVHFTIGMSDDILPAGHVCDAGLKRARIPGGSELVIFRCNIGT